MTNNKNNNKKLSNQSNSTTKFPCNKCSFVAPTNKLLRGHKEQQDAYKCGKCNLFIPSFDNVKTH